MLLLCQVFENMLNHIGLFVCLFVFAFVFLFLFCFVLFCFCFVFLFACLFSFLSGLFWLKENARRINGFKWRRRRWFSGVAGPPGSSLVGEPPTQAEDQNEEGNEELLRKILDNEGKLRLVLLPTREWEAGYDSELIVLVQCAGKSCVLWYRAVRL